MVLAANPKQNQKSKVKNKNDKSKRKNWTNPNIKIQMTIEIQMSRLPKNLFGGQAKCQNYVCRFVLWILDLIWHYLGFNQWDCHAPTSRGSQWQGRLSLFDLCSVILVFHFCILHFGGVSQDWGWALHPGHNRLSYQPGDDNSHKQLP